MVASHWSRALTGALLLASYAHADVPAEVAPDASEAPLQAHAASESSSMAGSARDRYSGPPLLFTQGPVTVGGYAGVSVLYTRVAGQDGVLVGGEGALLLDHRLSIGGAGYGWTRDTRGFADADGRPRNLRLGYGGAIVRYAFVTDSVVYGSVGALIGAGAVALTVDASHPHGLIGGRDIDGDVFFIFEPQLSAHVNLTRWMRVGLQGGYRLLSGIGRLGYTEGDVRGLSIGGTVQFGWL